jgi:hypothetical protein
MTEYEMASLFNEYQNSAQTVLMNSFSIVSAFLITSYFAAHRLTRVMAAGVIALFSSSIFFETLRMMGQANSIAGLRAQIREFAQAGKGLTWHGSASVSSSPQWLVDVYPAIVVATALIIYCGTIYFFFHCRRVNRMAEPGAAMPKA